jgi:hypothetical protein
MSSEACEHSAHGPLFCMPCLCSLSDVQHLSNKASHTKNLHVGGTPVLCSSFDTGMLDWRLGRRPCTRMMPDIVDSSTTSTRTYLEHCPAKRNFAVATRWKHTQRELTGRW